MSFAFGIDVGGSTVRAGLIDEAGRIERTARVSLSDRKPDAVIEQIARLLEENFAADYPEAWRGGAFGIGLAAQLNSKTGIVAVSPNHGWRDVPFGDLVRRRFGRPVRLINDLNAITLGEARVGAGRGAKDVSCIFVGTGVGMGALVDGRLVEGVGGMATELGHIKVSSPEDGRLCGCGMRGCLEAYTGGAQLPELISEKIARGIPSRLLTETGGDIAKINAATIEAAAVAGDRAALELWDEVADHLGRGIGTAITLFNPEVMILGGGVLRLAPTLVAKTRERVEAFVSAPYWQALRLVDSELGDNAGVVGAGLAAIEAVGR